MSMPLSDSFGVPFKAQALMRDLQTRLQLTVSGVTLTPSLDANNFPLLYVQRGSENIWLSIIDAGNAGRSDGLGLPQRAYSPHVSRILQSTTITDADLRTHVLAEAVKSGTELETFSATTITGVYATDAAAATQVSDVKSDAINPLTEQM